MTELVICKKRRRILEATGHVLVTGGPGSGKTTIALRKAVERIEQGLEPGQKVLFLSFSRAAVSRIVDSAKRDLPLALRRYLEIQTFHSFCWQLLQGHAYLLGSPRRLEIMLPHDERAHRSGATKVDKDWIVERERLFAEEGRIIFDLFAPKALELLSRSDALRRVIAGRYPLVIVDEAQDTGEQQWACIRELCELVQLVFLADLEQQIYDFRPDVSEDRVIEIENAIGPMRVELGMQNNRSPGVEIVSFGNDILSNQPRGYRYEGIHHHQFNPKQKTRDLSIRKAVGTIYKLIRERTGAAPKSVAVLTNWGKGVAIIARALQGGEDQKAIPHRVVIDEANVFLATRVVAKLLEPIDDEWQSLSSALDLLSQLYRAKGKTTKAEQLLRNAQSAREQALRGPAKAPRALKAIINSLKAEEFTGNPGTDWLDVRRRLQASGVAELKLVAGLVVYLMAFNRGRRISDSLTEAWLQTGSYQNANSLIEAAITQDQLAGGDGELQGINVMTIHKSKGKEFDGVVLVHIGNNISPLCPDWEKAPHTKSRKLLRVGVTRARHDALLLTDAFSPCFLLKGHNLKRDGPSKTNETR
ncbi:ATP-dependent helicase [Wenzhouxiangella sp. XN201]|uniref:UvrD-helicase domain-containing protein n=1 Tax=Wenzhouxiangella sp. XN201 TaxID=2710755 RepID=UPI0013C582EE|nr:ATP-dependent helicase [Wenzhouxiangella sp. XN201]NEZ02797.1 ATP-dependent helicase [Wenzhouxiangella sp. XN201]